MQDTITVTAREADIGYDVLGPIIHRYFLGLRTYTLYLGGHDTTFLYCARGGVRIKRLFDRCADLAGWQQDGQSHILWVSRLLACKASYFQAPEVCDRCIQAEFPHGNLGQVVSAIMRNQPWPPDRKRFIEQHRDRPASEFPSWLQTADAQPVRDYLAACERNFGANLLQLTRGRNKAVLIDTGWQGTTQAILARAHPRIDWKGLYFGRMLGESSAHSDPSSVIGIMFENHEYDANNKASAIVFHRHLIEALFEPRAPSVEEVYESHPGSIGRRQAEGILNETVDENADRLFLGVQSYLEHHAGESSVADIMARGTEALVQLHDLILHPTPEIALALQCKERSHDFGRDGSAPVLHDPSSSPYRDAETRIRHALWAQGQMALEFPPKQAAEAQASLIGAKVAPGGSQPRVTAAVMREASTVAIITRTKHRPILLERAARSVASQSYPHYRWVVVNDGGDIDPVRSVLDECSVDPSKITLVENETSIGMEAASNKGIMASDSDYIVIHDDDDSWEPKFLAEAVGFLDDPQSQRYGGVMTHSVYISEEIDDGNVIERGRWPYKDWVRNVHLAEMACDNMFPPIAFVFRRRIYNEIGGFREELPVLGDWCFNLEFLFKTDIGVIAKPLANYHHRDRSSGGAYSNSVIGGVSKHEEFNAVVRNLLLRQGAAGSPVHLVVALGYLNKEVRHHGELARNQPIGSLSGSAQDIGPAVHNADFRWALLEIAAKRSIWSRLDPRAKSTRKITTIPALKALLRRERIQISAPPDFDEQAYLSRYPDVAAVVSKKELPSGFAHYLLHGSSEGRSRPFPK